MALFTGTRIGADGKRYPSDAEDIPADSDEERPRMVPVYGQPADGEVPVWNADKRRLEWGAGSGGGGEGGGGDGIDEARIAAIEQTNTEQNTALTSISQALDGLSPAFVDIGDRLGELEATTIVSDSGITNLETITQADYDALSPPDPNTVYVIVTESL